MALIISTIVSYIVYTIYNKNNQDEINIKETIFAFISTFIIINMLTREAGITL